MPRLFFALPLTTIAPALVDWRERQPWPGQLIPEANLHLTLAFLGEADQANLAHLMAAARRQHCPPLRISRVLMIPPPERSASPSRRL